MKFWNCHDDALLRLLADECTELDVEFSNGPEGGVAVSAGDKIPH
jgi:hypothetical protein